MNHATIIDIKEETGMGFYNKDVSFREITIRKPEDTTLILIQQSTGDYPCEFRCIQFRPPAYSEDIERSDCYDIILTTWC